MAALILGMATTAGGAQTAGWAETSWNGERAYVADSGAWRAIVSVDRGRLVYFGGADGVENLLFAPATRGEEVGWGGHRIWLGPQSEWGWPPPAAWEASAAESVRVAGGVLDLVLPDAGAGWPRVTRRYFWKDDALHCDAQLTGGTRPAQVIQIFQTPVSTVPELTPSPTARATRGYVQVHGGRVPSPRFEFTLPPHVAEAGKMVRLKFLDQTEKLGFEPQTIGATNGKVRWQVMRGASGGRGISMPDEGYATQVFLGSGKDHLIELEQLSPLWAPGSDAHFEVILRAE